MLRDLRYLRIHGHVSDTNDQLALLSDPPPHIKVLELDDWTTTRVPQWICGLQCLYSLKLVVNKASTDELHALGDLPSLVNLSLIVVSIPRDTTVVFSAGLFPALELFKCISDYDVTAYLAFEAGAMPKLRSLELHFNERHWGGAATVGLQHLLCLKHITIHITDHSEEFPLQAVHNANSVFKKCTRRHPGQPSFTVDGHGCYSQWRS
uniref:Uncharacterized protein n=1 Tax=Avena sativa TaxID=4498 RepID=A0ACD5Z7L5_AVESA